MSTKTYFLQTREGDVLAEVEATSPFTASCGAAAEDAPDGCLMVELGTGIVVAVRCVVAGALIGWKFARHVDFESEESAA